MKKSGAFFLTVFVFVMEMVGSVVSAVLQVPETAIADEVGKNFTRDLLFKKADYEIKVDNARNFKLSQKTEDTVFYTGAVEKGGIIRIHGIIKPAFNQVPFPGGRVVRLKTVKTGYAQKIQCMRGRYRVRLWNIKAIIPRPD